MNQVFSNLAWGSWRIPLDTPPSKLLSLLNLLLSLNITTIDCSDIYGGGDHQSERILGNVFKNHPELRRRFVIVTKCNIRFPGMINIKDQKIYDTNTEYIIQQVTESLKSLKTDYIDVLLLHRWDVLMDVDEVVSAFKALDFVKFFGVSNHSINTCNLLQARMSQYGLGIITNQIEINPFQLDGFMNGVLDWCQEKQINPMAWSPLAGSAVFSKDYENVVDSLGQIIPSERVEKVNTILNKIAEELNTNVDVVCFGWIKTHPCNICPIIGTCNEERILELVKGLEKIGGKLSRRHWYMIWESSGGPMP